MARRTRRLLVLTAAGLSLGVVGWHAYRRGRQAQLDTELVAAVVGEHAARAGELLKQGADPNYWPLARVRPGWRGWVDKLGGGRRWPAGRMLILATSRGRYRTVPVLLRYGADPNVRGRNGVTALALEVGGAGDATAVRWLLDYGASPNAADRNGETPLMQAAATGHMESVRLLLEHGADPNARQANDWTALMEATVGGPQETVALLLQHGADPNARDFVGGTALAWAALQGRRRQASVLLAHGADPTLRNMRGQSPADIADDPALGQLLRRAEGEWWREHRHPGGT